MNLENFDQKSTILINAAFSYASENYYAYLRDLDGNKICAYTTSKI